MKNNSQRPPQGIGNDLAWRKIVSDEGSGKKAEGKGLPAESGLQGAVRAPPGCCNAGGAQPVMAAVSEGAAAVLPVRA